MDKFAQTLGIPKITIQQLHKMYHETEQEAVDALAEQSHMARLEEGNPFHFNERQLVKFGNSSRSVGLLDFYEGLSTIHWLHSVIECALEEMVDIHKPENWMRVTALHLAVIKAAHAEFIEVKTYEGKGTPEYKGKELIEEDFILGYPDKMSYFEKELIADMGFVPKNKLNPYHIAKMDVEVIFI